MLGKRTARILALILIAAFGLSAMAFMGTGAFRTGPEPAGTGTEAVRETDDLKTAADISNVTGAAVEEIIKLKSEGKSWNKIMELLAGKSGNKNTDVLNGMLDDSGLDGEFLGKLEIEGFKPDEVTEARMLAERVVFQLSEICGQAPVEIDIIVPVPGSNGEDDISSYRKLAGEISLRTAVYTALRLKNEYGGVEGALDEYLLSLQLDIDIAEYLNDLKTYEKLKLEKGDGFLNEDIITVGGIENKMLQVLNAKNKNHAVQEKIGSTTDTTQQKPVTGVGSPEPALPDMRSLRPKNPAEEIMEEIKMLKEGSVLNIEEER